MRRLLARRGYLLTRMEPGDPVSLPAYLQRLQTRREPPKSVVCFDNETPLQSEILDVYPEDQVLFSCPLFSSNDSPLAPNPAPFAPPGRFVAVVDVELLAIGAALEKFPWLPQAEVLLIRARLGAFWSAELDVCDLSTLLEKRGFSLEEVIGPARMSSPQAPVGRTILAYERHVAGSPRSTGARRRTNEAAAYLSAPIVRRQDFCLLAGRGSGGYAAGVHNPGAIVEQGRTYLLPRADRTPWARQKADESLFFTSSQPLLLTLEEDGHVASLAELSGVGLPDSGRSRTGDFRLFKFGGRIFTNHFLMSSPRRTVPRRPLQIDQLQTRVGISRLDIEKRQLVWCGLPCLDRPLAKAEKNWAMFTNGERLFLLYSFAPYILLAADDWPGLNFTTIVEAAVTVPFGGDGLPIRNSVNPVDYDEAHWLHIVHKVYPSKQYTFWAVLLDKQTLRPVRVTARPLVRGWQSYAAAIIYTCSVVAGPTDILLFSGLATAVAKVSRHRLDAEWVPVANEQSSQKLTDAIA